jgi:hypothetical protein
MIFCNSGPIASASYIFIKLKKLKNLYLNSYLGKEVVASAHAAFIKGV